MKALNTLARGSAFEYAGQRWIVLEHNENGSTLCLTENIMENRAFDDDNCNDWSKSSSKAYLNGAFLDNMIDTAGSGAACLESEVDLTTYDFVEECGTCKATIFLITEDQYRRNRDVIPNADGQWLSTAVSTASSVYESDALYINADGALYWGSACINCGLRPACNLCSDLPISKEDTLTPGQAGKIVKELAERFCGTFAFRSQFYGAVGFLLNSLKELPEYEVEKESAAK